MESNELNKKEVKHFKADTNGINDAYGYVWNIVVNEYLKTGFKDEQSKCEVDYHGVKYRILKRANITSFYDEAGNTLFDVENERLEKEYELMKASIDPEDESNVSEPMTQMGKTIADIEKQAFENVESNKQIEDRAIKKLEDEIKKAKDDTYATPIGRYIIKQCEENLELARRVITEAKTLKGCMEYIIDCAKKVKSGRVAVVSDEKVFSWAVNYYLGKNVQKTPSKNTEKIISEPTKKQEPKPKTKDIDGQLDLFSMTGGD